MSAETVKTPPPAAKEREKPKEKPAGKKKGLPTNCTQCNTRIRRKNWYYHNGKYFCGKKCAKNHWQKQLEEKKKAQEGQNQKQDEAPGEPPKTG